MARITEYVGPEGVRSSALDQWRAAHPQPGDLIRWPDGTYGRIESLHDPESGRGWAREGEAHVCQEQGSAFLGWNERKRRPAVDISGGPFRTVKLEHLRFEGTRLARFWNWGDNMPGADMGCEYHLVRPVYAYTPPEEGQ